jgi:hypothetical protein
VNLNTMDEDAKKQLATEMMEKVEQHFSSEDHAPLFMPRKQYDVLSPYLTGFFLIDWESPFDEVTDLPPMVTITDWMAAGS